MSECTSSAYKGHLFFHCSVGENLHTGRKEARTLNRRFSYLLLQLLLRRYSDKDHPTRGRRETVPRSERCNSRTYPKCLVVDVLAHNEEEVMPVIVITQNDIQPV